MQNADLIEPSSSGRSQRSCCSGDPNSASTSMLPVSGAAQFSASGASAGLHPVISASAAYCRLVSGGSGRLAPSSRPTAAAALPVRKRFHSPRLRASALSSLVIGTRSHGRPCPTAAATCSANTASAG